MNAARRHISGNDDFLFTRAETFEYFQAFRLGNVAGQQIAVNAVTLQAPVNVEVFAFHIAENQHAVKIFVLYDPVERREFFIEGYRIEILFDQVGHQFIGFTFHLYRVFEPGIGKAQEILSSRVAL